MWLSRVFKILLVPLGRKKLKFKLVTTGIAGLAMGPNKNLAREGGAQGH